MLPLWPHTLGGICYNWFYHTWLITLLRPSMSLLQTLWNPWTIFLPLMFPRSSLETPVIGYTQLFNPFLCIYAAITLKPMYIGMCAKGQRFLDTLKGEELNSKKTIVHCCQSLYLTLHPFVPWSTLCSSQAFLCLWACYQEMEDLSGGGPGGGLSFSDSQTCRQRLSLL